MVGVRNEAEEAVVLLRTERPDLVLLDVQSAGQWTSFEVLQRAGAGERVGRVAVVTAHATGNAPKAFDAAAIDFTLLKPYTTARGFV